MTRRIILLFFSIAATVCCWSEAAEHAIADEGVQQQVAEKKYTFSICSVFKNESQYLREWIEYHRLIGAEHFFLYDNDSSDYPEEVLQAYIDEGLVTLVFWPDQPSDLPEHEPYRWVLTTQAPAFAHACWQNAGVTEWMALIDLDEFILPMQADTFTELLQQYESAPGITLLWHVYGNSWLDYIPDDCLLIEALHRTFPPDNSINKDVMKSVVKPEFFARFYWPPHACMYKCAGPPVAIQKEIARINHYMIRSNRIMRIKIENREKSSNHIYSEDEKMNLLNQGNDVEDEERAILRFAPKLREVLSL